MAQKKLQLDGYVSFEVVFKDTHPDYNDEDLLHEAAMEAWDAAVAKAKLPKGMIIEGKPSISEV